MDVRDYAFLPAPNVFDETRPGVRDESPETIWAIEKQDAPLAGLCGRGQIEPLTEFGKTLRLR